MKPLTILEAYKDDRGNEIIFDGRITSDIRIVFTGSNNKLVVAADVKLGRFNVQFDCDNGRFEIGGNARVPEFSCNSRIGQDARIIIGRDVSATTPVMISSVEGNTVQIGNDVMFASGNELRSDDGHPIFDVRSGARVNPVRPIVVGDHVWIGGRAVLLGGTTVGNGSVVGYASVLKSKVPNNCIVVGTPARVVKRSIAWERPHLSLTKPFYKPHSSTVTKSGYWALTQDDEGSVPVERPSFIQRVKRAVAAF